MSQQNESVRVEILTTTGEVELVAFEGGPGLFKNEIVTTRKVVELAPAAVGGTQVGEKPHRSAPSQCSCITCSELYEPTSTDAGTCPRCS